MIVASVTLLTLAASGCASLRPGNNSTPSVSPEMATAAGELGARETAELCLATGQQFEQGGRYAEAAIQYERVVRNRPETPGVQHRLAVIYDRLSEHERASRCFQKALEESPGDGRLWNDFGFYHYQRGRWQEAETAFRKSCELAPHLERNFVNLGLTLAQQGRVDEAYGQFTRVISPAAAHSNLGMIFAQQGRHAEARVAFDRSLACEPGLPQPHAARQFLASGETNEIRPVTHETPIPSVP